MGPASPTRLIPFLLLTIWLLELATLGLAPLMDPTEGRYASIGKTMALSGDFTTPMLHGEPFWSKPPLHFWLMALSFEALGINEFAARLPGILAGIATVGLLYWMARSLHGVAVARRSAAICATSALAIFGGGGVMTDATLTAAVTGAMAGVIFACRAESPLARRGWSQLFFISLALGALAKGPIALILCFAGIFIASVLSRDWRWARALDWPMGLLSFLAVCVPWYAMAEHRTPGFLRYFLLNENFQRFVDPHYQDRFGHGHPHSLGTIWPMSAMAFLPWTPLLVWTLWRKARSGGAAAWRMAPSTAWIAGWALAPLLFFSLAHNVIVTYVFPSVPAWAWLAALGWEDAASPPWQSFLRRLTGGTTLALSAALIGVLILLRREIHLSAADWTIAALLFGGLGLGALLAGQRLEAHFVLISLVVPLAGCFFSAALASPLGLARSTRKVSRAILGEKSLQGHAVIFYSDAPYSSGFYLPAFPASLKRNKDAMLATIEDDKPDTFIFREEEARGLSTRYLEKLRLVLACGIYRVYTER